jgi:hypothetical protein
VLRCLGRRWPAMARLNIRHMETPSMGCTLDAKTNDAAGEHVHHYQHAVTAQEDGFAAEQVGAPQAILRVCDEVSQEGPSVPESPGR